MPPVSAGVPPPPVSPPVPPPVSPVPPVPPVPPVSTPVPPVVSVVVVGVVVVAAPVPLATSLASAGGTRAGVEVGIWSQGRLSPPQAERPSAQVTTNAQLERTRVERMLLKVATGQAGGAIRRPQVGHSLRSRCAIAPQKLQKRRFSTAQGSFESDGASGKTSPTTSSSSPFCWSR